MDPVTVGLAILKKYWKEILIVLVIAGAFFYVRHLQNTVESQRTTIARMAAANTILEDSNKKLTNTVTANNVTIAKLSEGANQTKKEFDHLNTKVEQQTASLAKRLKDILAQKAPVTCDDTIKYMINAAPTYKQ